MNQKLLKLRQNLLGLEYVQKHYVPDLVDFNQEKWEESKLDQPNGSNCITSWQAPIDNDREREVYQTVVDISTEDLMDLQALDNLELEGRKGYSHLLTMWTRLSETVEDMRQNLLQLQAYRECGIIEVERRVRQKMIQEHGEKLDSFVSRFLFGPEPGPMVPPGSLAGAKPMPRKFLMARVPSGKQVAVETLHFEFPKTYDAYLFTEMDKQGIWNKPAYYYSSYGAPRTADQKVAKFYYEFGLKPSKSVQVNYSIGTSYNGKDWSLSHTRSFETNQLSTVD